MKRCMVAGQARSEYGQSMLRNELQTCSLQYLYKLLCPSVHGCTDGGPVSSFSSLYLHYEYVTWRSAWSINRSSP